ncbi:MAG: porphobilinogen synthase [Devosiaceae bacterium]|nr:porphobilinogen synthase [Devosiaceae bacterium]
MSTNFNKHNMKFLEGRRLRRLRSSAWQRNMVRQNAIVPSDLILPIFIIDGENERSSIKYMPNIERLSVDLAVKRAKLAYQAGIPAVALFPKADESKRNEQASEAINKDNLICRALSEIKSSVPEIGLITDVALDLYTSHGQDGLMRDNIILNDESVDVMVKSALIQAEAGADIIAPSDMMDGRVGAIRIALDESGFEQIPILSYSAKYASSFYGPFREAVGSSSLLKGNKFTYQLDFANSDEAILEIEQDILEGADMIMIKPGMPYLDIIRQAVDRFNIPIFAYQVSGEYSLIEYGAQNGAIDRDSAIFESLMAFKRAGCTGVFTYFALEMAQKLNK